MMATRRFTIALTVLLAASFIAGCGMRTRADKLKEATLSYNNDVRWSRFRAAARALPPARREAWVAAMDNAARYIRILEYDMRAVRIEGDDAVFEIDLSYMRSPGVTVERKRRLQHWSYADGNWTLNREQEVELVQPGMDEPPGDLPLLSDPATASSSSADQK